jgi:hypothetical protein
MCGARNNRGLISNEAWKSKSKADESNENVMKFGNETKLSYNGINMRVKEAVSKVWGNGITGKALVNIEPTVFKWNRLALLRGKKSLNISDKLRDEYALISKKSTLKSGRVKKCGSLWSISIIRNSIINLISGDSREIFYAACTSWWLMKCIESEMLKFYVIRNESAVVKCN